MTKKAKKIITILASLIVVLSVVITISIAYNFNGGFYFSRVVQFAKILGEEQTINIDGEGSFVTACNFAGTTLLGDDLSQQINIKTSNTEAPLYLRAKVELVGFKQQNNIIFGFTNWEQKEDGYIYFNQPIDANQQIGLCKYVRLDKNNNLQSNQNYILVFVVEAFSNAFTNS